VEETWKLVSWFIVNSDFKLNHEKEKFILTWSYQLDRFRERELMLTRVGKSGLWHGSWILLSSVIFYYKIKNI
jgi:hypothetical protein